jgi:surface protein
MCLPSLGCRSILIRILISTFFSCALTVNVIDLLFLLATVFSDASAFNGDLSKWNVAKVTTMQNSKSISILVNDLNVT